MVNLCKHSHQTYLGMLASARGKSYCNSQRDKLEESCSAERHGSSAKQINSPLSMAAMRSTGFQIQSMLNGQPVYRPMNRIPALFSAKGTRHGEPPANENPEGGMSVLLVSSAEKALLPPFVSSNSRCWRYPAGLS